METEFIPVNFDKVIQSKSYTCVVLKTEEKTFAIYTDTISGGAMQMYLTKSEKIRPYTHDLINMIFRGLDISIKQIVINELNDTIYLARLFLEQKMDDILHIVEIDARPSDCITLALINRTPVYCTREVLDKAVPLEV